MDEPASKREALAAGGLGGQHWTHRRTCMSVGTRGANTDPDALAEFRSFSLDERSGFKCQQLTVAMSGWAVECILSHDPGFSRHA